MTPLNINSLGSKEELARQCLRSLCFTSFKTFPDCNATVESWNKLLVAVGEVSTFRGGFELGSVDWDRLAVVDVELEDDSNNSGVFGNVVVDAATDLR